MKRPILVSLLALAAYTAQLPPASAVEENIERVSPFMGSFSHGIPIAAPPFKSVGPNLSLGYSSEGRNGLVGVGWNLSGFGQVERKGPGLGVPTFGATDVFALNGQELVPCISGSTSASCIAGGTHSTKVESYLKIRFESASNTWYLWTKDGTRTSFTPIMTLPQGTLLWGQSTVTSTKGHEAWYQWALLNGEAYPYAVSYNGFSVTMYWEARPERLTLARINTMGQITHRLRSIVVCEGSSTIRAYKLTYGTSGLTGRSLLTSVQMFGKDAVIDGGLITGGTSAPASTFTYRQDPASDSGRVFLTQAAAAASAPTTENVSWTNRIRVYAVGTNGNSLMKESGAYDWDAGAISTRALASGGGYVEWRAGDGPKMAGLSNGNTNESAEDIDFALYEAGSSVYVYEAGTTIGPWPMAVNDLLRVEVLATNVVQYKRNNVLLYTSTRTPVYPLLVDTSIRAVGATINAVVLSGLLVDGAAWCSTDTLLTGDFNGDSRTDQLCYRALNAGTAEVRLATATGFQPMQLWGNGLSLGNYTLGDFNNDGKTDILTHDNWYGDVRVFLSLGNVFAAATPWGNVNAIAQNGTHQACKTTTGVAASVGTGDFNGDGLLDMSCKIPGRQEIFIGLSTSTSFNFSIFAEVSCDVWEATGSGDFNKDGKDDWYCIGAGMFRTYTSSGSSFSASGIPGLTTSFCSNPAAFVFGDANGDGATDVFCRETGKTAFFTGTQFIEAGTPGAWCSSNIFMADVDGDGAGELVCNEASSVFVRKWDGLNWGPAPIWKASWCADPLSAGDFNGDGKTDVLCKSKTDSVAVAGTAGVVADLMISHSNGLGGSVQVEYTSSTTAANVNAPPPKQVVTAVTTNDGRTTPVTTRYQYSGGLMDRKNKRYAGFRFVREDLPCNVGETTCPFVVRYLLQNNLATMGAIEIEQHWKKPNMPVISHNFAYLVTETAGVSSALQSSAAHYTIDDSTCSVWPCPHKMTYTTMAYDAYGNLTGRLSYGDYYAAGDERYEDFTYYANPSAYIVGLLGRQRVFSGVDAYAPWLSIDRYAYDGATDFQVPPTQGYVTRQERRIDNAVVFKTMSYDQWGNRTSVTDETNRTTQRTYDATHHEFVVSQTLPSLETSSQTWDYGCGLPLTATDANAQQTTSQYDPLCRLTRTEAPLGAYETRQYPSLGTPSQQRLRIETPPPAGSSQPSFVEQFFDGLGRNYKTAMNGPGSAEIVMLRNYHNRGQVYQESAPYYAGSTSYLTTYTYDGFGRLTRTQLPDSTQTTNTYGLWSTSTTDSHGHVHSETFNAYGEKLTSSDAADNTTVTTTYTHDLLGRLTQMRDAEQNEWTWTFDTLGRLTERKDPDSGLWRFTYDNAGRLLFQDDAKNQRTQFQYDIGGRLAYRRAGTDTGTIFRYGELRGTYKNVGRLTSIEAEVFSSPIPSLRYDYDAAGRTVRTSRDLDGITFTLEHRFDSMGRLLGMTWPDGDAVGTPTDPWRYDAAGRLIVVPGILSSVTYDAAGRPLVQQNVNGTTTTRSYSPTRGFLQSISTVGPPNVGTIQNLAYDIDPSGMALSVTSNVPSETSAYGYDGFHRLLSEGPGAGTPGNANFQYDALGRMTYNSRVGYYTYPGSGQLHPHAPLAVAGNSYSYDLNGNLESGNSRSIVWNADNRVASVALPSLPATQFEYGGDGSRIKKTFGTTTVLYPLGDDYEVTVGGSPVKYIQVPGLGTIAKRIWQGSGIQTFWLHADRLSSLHATTDASGNQVLRRTYSAYGETLTGGAQPSESRGFIGERRDETGLIYLHARYYDPGLGLFISPDPIGSKGGLNEFAYADGDPVNKKDPSGLAWQRVCTTNRNSSSFAGGNASHTSSQTCTWQWVFGGVYDYAVNYSLLTSARDHPSFLYMENFLLGSGSSGSGQAPATPATTGGNTTTTNNSGTNVPYKPKPGVVGGTTAQQQDVLDAKQDAIHRVLTRSTCGAFYGGTASSIIHSTEYRIVPFGNQPGEASTNRDANNPTVFVTSVFINTQGAFFNAPSSIVFLNGSTRSFNSALEFRSFVLLHEVGHQAMPITGFGPDVNRSVNEQQSRRVLNACF